jgi:hypothetical protein
MVCGISDKILNIGCNNLGPEIQESKKMTRQTINNKFNRFITNGKKHKSQK